MKRCFHCKEEKNPEEFYKNKTNKDGLTSDCKICVLKRQYYEKRESILEKRRVYREKNRDKISLKEATRRLNDADRFEKNRQRHFSWSKNNRKRLNAYQREWYQENKEKRRAHVVLSRAIRAGKIVRPINCSQCLKECKPDGHHEEYSKPLEVIWICRACHSRKSPRTVIK